MYISQNWRTGIAVALGILVLAILAGAAVVYFGLYDVTATRESPAPVYRFLHTVMRRSVSERADGIHVPDLREPGRVRSGFLLYREHCEQCHGAPGVSPQPFAIGLRPQPPSLLIPAREWPSSHIYWVIKYGVTMSAMPEWEYRLDEKALWDVTAFVKYLPAMSPTDYRQWDQPMPRAVDAASADDAAARPGDPAAGRRAVNQYLCATCHRIPGVVGAWNTVGPALGGITTRAYIAGSLKNSPANMMRWLRDPPQVKPNTAMPNLHIREQDVRDIAAFLYTLDQSN
jgi:mono/diheme cytochrome c family protein